MKLRYPKTREEFNELVAYVQAKPVSVLERNTVPGGKGGLPLFRGHSPEVQARARVRLDSLLIKHKAKLESKPYGYKRNYYYGRLVAVAISLAKRDLGLDTITWAEFKRLGILGRRHKSRARTLLGMQEPLGISNCGANAVKAASQRRKSRANLYNPNPSNGQVNQGDLTGV